MKLNKNFYNIRCDVSSCMYYYKQYNKDAICRNTENCTNANKLVNLYEDYIEELENKLGE